jgi:hypothetical protein
LIWRRRVLRNPQRLVRKAAPAAKDEVRPLALATVDAICAADVSSSAR